MNKIISVVAILCMSLTPSTSVVSNYTPELILEVEVEYEELFFIQGLDDIESQLSANLKEMERVRMVEQKEQEIEMLIKKEMIKRNKVELDETDVVKVLEEEVNATPTHSHGYTSQEIEVLHRITEAEATGASIEAKKNVASVIINRVRSDRFPDTIEGVVFQKSQFSPIYDGRFYSVDITNETIQAVDSVLNNSVTNNALFFCNYKDVGSLSTQKWFNNLTYLFKDDSEHSFYR